MSQGRNKSGQQQTEQATSPTQTNSDGLAALIAKLDEIKAVLEGLPKAIATEVRR